ncbi:MAG: hypothetical protein IKK03_08795 [Lachnospiraceae bacterium]|nr:hypothetical protein [Lachnospiraceae bacterium]
MKNKNLKHLLVLTMSLSMVAGLAACGNTDTPSANVEETQQTVVESTSTSTQESETPVEPEEITYPLDTDVTLSVWTNRLALNSEYSDYTESPFHTGLAEHTGVDLEFQFPAKGLSAKEAYNLLLTEDVLPDIIFRNFSNGTAELEQLYNDGVIYDLTEYLPVYAPDYWAVLTSEEYEDVYKCLASDEGRIYGFAAIYEGDYNKTYRGPIIRQDWLDECGLEAPVTIEDWENVLTTFKDKYGAALALTSDRLLHDWDGLNAGVGAYSGGVANWYLDDNNEIQFAQLQPEWVEYMKVLNRWYKNGLIDPDSITMDANALRTKAVNNQVGATIVPMSQMTNIVTDAENTGNGADWVGVSYARTAAGEPTCAINTSSTNWISKTTGVVTTSCPEEELITALQFLNYGYTEEGHMYYNFGEEGETYTLNAAGEPEWTDLITGDAQGLNCVTKYTGATSSPIAVQASRFVQMKNNEAAAEAVYTWIDNTEVGKHVVPELALTEEENLTYSDYFAAIQTYVQETTQKFITGELSVDDYIDDFYAQLENMGIKECQAIRQAAYERYLAK